MKTKTKKIYEALFLLNPAAADEKKGIKAVKKLLEKAKAEIISVKKWDERTLAYAINGHDHGIYILSYFRSEGSKIQGIENQVRLAEEILRVLILSAEAMKGKDIEQQSLAENVQKQSEEAAEEDMTRQPEETTG